MISAVTANRIGEQMAKDSGADTTIRIKKSLAIKINKIALHRNESVSDLISPLLDQVVSPLWEQYLADEHKAFEELQKEKKRIRNAKD